LSRIYSLPNLLTLTRLCLIPILILVFYLPWKWSNYTAAAIFLLASLTDWLDGYLARKWQQETLFGAFLDPVADKVLVATALLLLVGVSKIHFITLPAIVIVGREIVISALREWMAEWGKRASVAVGMLGKIKTILQMLALLLLLAFHSLNTWLASMGVVLLYVAALITIWSMVVYMRIAYQEMGLSLEQEKN